MPEDGMTITMSVKQFDVRVRRLQRQTIDRLWVALRKFTLDLMAEIMARTPVDTGRARASWLPYIRAQGGQAGVGGTPRGSPLRKKEGSYKLVSPRAKSSRGEMSVRVWSSVPYIVALEYGHSKQAPKGMVRVTVRRYKPLLGKVLRAILRGRGGEACVRTGSGRFRVVARRR